MNTSLEEFISKNKINPKTDNHIYSPQFFYLSDHEAKRSVSKTAYR